MEQFKLELRRALEFVRQSEHLVQSHTRPEDPVLFLPDDAALYFLADRLNPTRFDLFFTMVVDKYRKEAWEAIKRTQPLVVLETSGFRFYRDELQLGQLLEFLKERYRWTSRSTTSSFFAMRARPGAASARFHPRSGPQRPASWGSTPRRRLTGIARLDGSAGVVSNPECGFRWIWVGRTPSGGSLM